MMHNSIALKVVILLVKFETAVYTYDLLLYFKYWPNMPNIWISLSCLTLAFLYFLYSIYNTKNILIPLITTIILLILTGIITKVFTNGDFLFSFLSKVIGSKHMALKFILFFSFMIIAENYSLNSIESRNTEVLPIDQKID